MLSMPMPFTPDPCQIWLPTWGEPDLYGNARPEYGEDPDIETTCCWAPGHSAPDTSDDIEEDRPHGDVARFTFYLPKTLDADLRSALIATPGALGGAQLSVEGTPTSYMRGNTPGDYSWCVEAVTYLG